MNQTADDRLHSLLALTERLTTLIQDENDKVQAGDRAVLRKNQAEKDTLARQYDEELRAVRQNPGMLKGGNPALREKLKAATKRFEKASEKHSLIAVALMQVADNLIKTIRNATIEKKQPVTGYGRNGVVNRMPSGYGAQFVPIAVHQVV